MTTTSAKKPSVPVTHKAGAKDTLAIISQQYYGIPTLTDFIYSANSTNKDITADPNALIPVKKPPITLTIPTLPEKWQALITTLKENGANFQVFGGFQDINQLEATAPYLLPPLVAPNTFNSPIELRLNGLNTSASPQEKIDNNPDFQFAWVTDPKIGVQTQITVKNGNVWKADAKAQNALRANFVAFLAAVETLELAGKLIAGASALVGQAIAESLPMPLSQASFYASGFNDGFSTDKNPYVDLRPGMRLRLESASNQFIAPGSPFNVPAATGQIVYSIVRGRGQRIAFDAFLGAMNTPNISSSTTVRKAVGLVDLQAAGSARRYYRLFYPREMLPATSFGDDKLEHSITLIGADTLADLNKATTAYLDRCETTTAAAGNSPLVYVVFQGRVSAIVEIAVYITHGVTTQVEPALTFVPLGTTVRQIFDQALPFANPRVLHSKPIIRFSRFHVGADGLPQHRTVVFRPDMATEANYSVFDIPLAKGDRVEIRLADDKPSALPN